MTASNRIQKWRLDPIQFVRDNFKVEPDAWQRDALTLCGVPKPRKRIVTKACTGPGKSALLAWEGWRRLSCYAEPGEHPKGAALSITAENLKANLWPELAKWQARSEFLKAAFTWQKERIFANDHPATWFLDARSFNRDADEQAIGRTLSGLHSKYPFVLLDETGDMPVQVARTAEQALSNCVDGLLMAAGNPTSTTGLLYDICTHKREQWEVITITADPDDPKRTPRVDRENAAEQIKLYGRDNPWVMATILGEFPPGGFNALLTITDVETAQKRHLKATDYEWAQKRIGGDVARFGDDLTVLAPRQGLACFNLVIMRNADTQEIAARLAKAKYDWGSELEFVDGTGGFGGGVIDALKVAGITAIDVQFSGRATDPRFYNKRAEIWWQMAEWVKSGGALPPDPALVKELTAPTYTFKNGKILIEEKDQIKKRLGFSPDRADAIAVTFAMPDQPGKQTMPWELLGVGGDRGKMKADWDPFAGA